MPSFSRGLSSLARGTSSGWGFSRPCLQNQQAFFSSSSAAAAFMKRSSSAAPRPLQSSIFSSLVLRNCSRSGTAPSVPCPAHFLSSTSAARLKASLRFQAKPPPPKKAVAASSPGQSAGGVARRAPAHVVGSAGGVVRRAPANVVGSAGGVAAVGATTSAAAVTRSFAEQLGRRSAPTLLYEAPSHFWFRASCIGAGLFCIGYTIINYWSIYLRPPPDLAWWVPHAFGVICVVMAGLGGYFILGSSRIVRVIQAVPTARVASLIGPAKAAKAAKSTTTAAATSTLVARTRESPILLELEIGRILPLLPARKLYVQPGAVTLPMRLTVFGLGGGAGGSAMTTAAAEAGSMDSSYDRVMARRAEEERKKKEHEYEMNHLMTAPFRHAWKGAQVAWKGIRRAFSREGFVKIEVEGRTYKLDVSGGWALDNGRALDRLVAIQGSRRLE